MSIDLDINLIIANSDSKKKVNRGKAYEELIFRKLKQAKLLHRSCKMPGGDNPAQPDAVFVYNGRPHNLEVKINELDVEFGELALTYDINKNNWQLAGQDTPLGKAKREFLKAVKAEDYINGVWGHSGPPMKFLYTDLKNFSKELKEHDMSMFPKKFLSVPLNSIEIFYAAKSTYYLQVGKRGFYYMRGDQAGIGCPKFMPRKVALKLRLKTNDASRHYRYSFVAALVAEEITPSIMDIDKSINFLQTSTDNKKPKYSTIKQLTS